MRNLFFPFSKRTRSHVWFISVYPQGKKELQGLGAENGFRRTEFSQESCMPCQQGIDWNKSSITIFDKWQIAWLLKVPFFQEARLEHGLEITIYIRLRSAI